MLSNHGKLIFSEVKMLKRLSLHLKENDSSGLRLRSLSMKE